ncbi:helix-turn-helix domain-containing protein [Candidatus Enterococcus ferrettii]|uniref:HTH cro/C1-type domain-containing protein n=1 Tax=Candidatus Enterococcus ferrettii TaxID=2815324 RepID=A0ABV0EK04_9ENTE|nr:helix-turn-helix transcriptional regulator [Enterococcus sp. 665A]MBO1338306.1 helix-turn-helix transcriptional regulator [Enterococcus sp. 665A]
MIIGEKIKEKRTEKKWTQEELAERLHVSRSTISGWEVGRNYPDLTTIVQLSDLLDISLDQLLREDHKMTNHLSKNLRAGRIYQRIIIGAIILLLVHMIYGQYLTKQADHYNDYLSQEGWTPNEEYLTVYEKTEKEITYLASTTRVYAANLFYLKNQFTLAAKVDHCETQLDSAGQLYVKIPKEVLLTDADYLMEIDKKGHLLPITSQTSIETAELMASYMEDNQTTHQKLIDGLLAKKEFSAGEN